MITRQITNSEIEPLKVASLPTRPTAPTAFGGKGYTSTEMKQSFDRLPLRILSELNTLISEIENGSLTETLCEFEPLRSLLSDMVLVKARLEL